MRNLVRYPVTDAEAIELLTQLRDGILADDAKAGVCGNMMPEALLHAIEAIRDRESLPSSRPR